ncbi:transcriptional regulator [Oxalobacteraceae bacterium CAVE-383]|nr:transcriptional regulator [Oxalobacteraceae bacterium CAVE-383]
MKIPIGSTAELGLLIRATRHAHNLRLDDVAGSANVGAVFVGDVEHGKETVQIGRVFRLLDELGLKVIIDIPQSALPELEKLKKTGLKPRALRNKKKTTEGPANG